MVAGAALAALLAGCSSSGGTPYGGGGGAQSYLPRAPVVAPSGPGSPWFWPLPNSWWPVQPWGDPGNPYIANPYTNNPLLR